MMLYTFQPLVLFISSVIYLVQGQQAPFEAAGVPLLSHLASSDADKYFAQLSTMADEAPDSVVANQYLQDLKELSEHKGGRLQHLQQFQLSEFEGLRAASMVNLQAIDEKYMDGRNGTIPGEDYEPESFWDSAGMSTAQGIFSGGKKSRDSLDPAKLAKVKMFAYFAAASYCMRWNVYPQWKCGFPRCKNPYLLSEEGTPFDQDVLAATKTIHYFSKPRTGTVGYIAVNPYLTGMQVNSSSARNPSILVAFRGTMSLKNFVYDLRLAKVDFKYPQAPKDAKIHSGFWRCWKDAEDDVLGQVRKVIEESPQDDSEIEIIFTGHSLGGAVSLLGGLEIRRMAREGTLPGLQPGRKVNVRVYAYGEPRVGNRAFAEWVYNLEDFSIYRTTYYNDLIAHIPPKSRGFRFHHHTAEIWITKWMRDTIQCDENSVGEDPRCGGGLWWLNILVHLTYWDVVFGPWC